MIDILDYTLATNEDICEKINEIKHELGYLREDTKELFKRTNQQKQANNEKKENTRRCSDCVYDNEHNLQDGNCSRCFDWSCYKKENKSAIGEARTHALKMHEWCDKTRKDMVKRQFSELQDLYEKAYAEKEKECESLKEEIINNKNKYSFEFVEICKNLCTERDALKDQVKQLKQQKEIKIDDDTLDALKYFATSSSSNGYYHDELYNYWILKALQQLNIKED